ncbi:hypothetical protein GCM10027062_21450 [Nocardioides hungaricus]
MSLPDHIATERLRLPLWTAADVAAIRSGQRREGWHPDYPRPDDVAAAALWRAGDTWAPRHVVRGVTALGSIGFFGPPEPAADGVSEVEVGYGLVAEAHGYGFATEALTGVLAETDALGVRVRASVEPTNSGSIRVLATCGFTDLRGTTEDGELVMVRPL